jgi:hypothetical protein
LLSQTIRARGYGFFWVSLGLAVLNVSFTLYAFATTREEFETERGLAIASDALYHAKFVGKDDIECAPRAFDEKAEEQMGTPSGNNDKRFLQSIGKWQIFTMPYVWTIASFLGVYQGAETVAQGFIVTFLLYERVGTPPLDAFSLTRYPFRVQIQIP